jgi:hypothetical protein
MEIADIRQLLPAANAVVTVHGITSRVASRGTAVVDHDLVASVLLDDGRRFYGEACFWIA